VVTCTGLSVCSLPVERCCDGPRLQPPRAVACLGRFGYQVLVKVILTEYDVPALDVFGYAAPFDESSECLGVDVDVVGGLLPVQPDEFFCVALSAHWPILSVD
jgi:hypothetical protein